jgi:hypothetical protein
MSATSARRPGRARCGDGLVAGLRAFDTFGRRTAVESADGVTYFANEFWTSAQRQAHALHEVSYRACFKPQVPEFFISRLTAPGDAVHDPFMGRGTAPLQAALSGRRPVGNDINPLSAMLVRPRLAPPSESAVAARLRQIPWRSGAVERDDLLAFYHPATLRNLSSLRRWLLDVAPADGHPDPVDDWIRMVALSRLTGHSAGYFSGYTLPPNQAVSVRSQRRINERLGLEPPERDIAALILKKTRSLLRNGPCAPHPAGLLCTGPADATPAIADASVSLVVTSPPFLDIVQYADDNWLRCWFAGIDAGGIAISAHRTEGAWTAMVRSVLA